MREILDQLIDRYHPQTIEAAKASQEIDADAIKAAAGDDTKKDKLALWIREYGVGRVGGLEIQHSYTPFATAMASAALDYFKRETFDDRSAAAVIKHFAHLRATFGAIYLDGGGKGGVRKMQSLTSKVLWLRMPEEAPLFDSQAETAIIFLGKLLKATTWEPSDVGNEGACEAIDEKWGWKVQGNKLSREVLDNYWYQDFFHSHSRIYEQCSEKIEARVALENLPWLTPFRYFDKFLWILGDKNRDYSLMRKADETFRAYAGPQLPAHKPSRDEPLA